MTNAEVSLSIPLSEGADSQHDNSVYRSNQYYRGRERLIRRNLRNAGFDAWGIRGVNATQPIMPIPELYPGDPYRIIRLASPQDFERYVRFAVLEPSLKVMDKVYNYEADRRKEIYYHTTSVRSPHKDEVVFSFLKDAMQRFRLHSHTVIRAYLFIVRTDCLNNPPVEKLDAESLRLHLRDYALTVHHSFWDMYVYQQTRERLRNGQDADMIKSFFKKRKRPWTSIEVLEV